MTINIKKLKDKATLHKIGWVILIIVLLGTLGMMSFLITQTTSEITVLNQTNQPQNSSPNEDLIDPQLNADIEAALQASQLATLVSLRDNEDYGVATRSYENGVFQHEVILSISDPPVGAFYESWLVGEKIVSTGQFKKDIEDNTYSLTFSTAEDLSSLNKVIVTQESLANGLDGKPELEILEGNF